MTPIAPFRAARRAAVVVVALSALAAPSAALAGSGGAGLGGSGSSGSTTSTTPSSSTGPYSSITAPIAATPADDPVSASGNGLSINSYAAGTLKKTVTFTGSAPTNSAGMTVQIQRTTGSSGTWTPTAHATVSASGSYTVHWVANRAGAMSFRAVLTSAASSNGQATAGAASAGAASPAVTVNVFTNAIATIYGPGFYGHKTACGQKLSKTMVGVASRTLKCGSMVQVYWHGKSVTVPVIDRGPYSNHATWDLTMATAQALGIDETETVGTITG